MSSVFAISRYAVAVDAVGDHIADERRARLVELCLALPEAVMKEGGGRHLRFEVRGRRFAYYLYDHHGDGRIALNCKVPLGDQEELVGLDPERFFVPAYLGPRGWLGVRLDLPGIAWDEIARFVSVSYGLIAPRRLAALATTIRG